MSNELEQLPEKQKPIKQIPKGFVPFEELCPQWSKQIDEYGFFDVKPKSTQLHIVSHAHCIVGEAHGFSDRYLNAYGTNDICKDCQRYSLRIFTSGQDIYGKEIQFLNAQQCDEFVQHFNEVHLNGQS